MSSTGVIFNIQRFSLNDGPGIRTTVFMKGCSLSCGWCHNPESRSFGVENIYGHKIGTEYTVDELFKEIEKDKIFFEESGGGITFSGGEPLSQPEFLQNLIQKCKNTGISCAIDTTGYADKMVLDNLIKITDLFLYDVKLIDDSEHMKYTGVSNQKILKNLDFLLSEDANVIIRIPMIPDISATEKNIIQVGDFLKKYKSPPEISLLPFHRIAESKYKKYGIENIMLNKKELKNTEIKHFQKILLDSGFNATIEGE